MKHTLLAEGIGTFALALSVLLSVTVLDPILATPLIAALVLGLFVYSIGSVSGCHINPAVTAGLWSLGKITTKDSIYYIAVQCTGALLALGLVSVTLGGVALGLAPESSSVFFAELVGMAFFTFGIAAVVFGRVKDAASGLVIGGSLLLGIMTAAHLGSAGILNPAVGLALGATSLSYIFGAVAGSVIGMHLYKMVLKN
ncbi:MAG: aquaporin Z [Patiriisocius sp.]|jgi:aquaporin Z